MKTDQVPQDASILDGHRRACYAEDEDGHYVIVPSRGWAVEKIVNEQARAEIERAVEQARRRVLQGLTSPLDYHMARRQMDVALLAANSGVWRWRVRRHLRPAVFARLTTSLLQRYADALGIEVRELCGVPPAAEQGEPGPGSRP